VRRPRKVVEGCFAVDMTRDGLIDEAAAQLFKIENFGYLGPDT
jgi:hypothetical protein